MKKFSGALKICAYIFFIANMLREAIHISHQTSYLNSGQLMGTESMIMIIWAAFISFLVATLIYGAGVIVEYHEKEKMKIVDDSTNE